MAAAPPLSPPCGAAALRLSAALLRQSCDNETNTGKEKKTTTPPVPSPRPLSTAPRLPLPPRVTNTGSELTGGGDFDKRPPLRISQGVPFHEAGGGPNFDKQPFQPLERRVSPQYLDALFADEVDEDDTAYWFTCPPSGWPTEERVAVAAKEIEPTPLSAVRPCADTWRSPLEAVAIGVDIAATVSAATFAAGVLVDIGAEVDGLLPVQATPSDAGWRPLTGGIFNPGTPCTVRVASVSYAPLARFPILLELVEPEELRPVFERGMAALRANTPGPGALDLRGGDYTRFDDATMDALTGGGFTGGVVPRAPPVSEETLDVSAIGLRAAAATWGRARAEAAGDPTVPVPDPVSPTSLLTVRPGAAAEEEPAWAWVEAGSGDDAWGEAWAGVEWDE